MKTEDLLRYERMYREMRVALKTPWLHFEHGSPVSTDSAGAEGSPPGRRLAESAPGSAFHGANEQTRPL